MELARFDETGQLELSPFGGELEEQPVPDDPAPTSEELDDLYDSVAPGPVDDDGEPRSIDTGTTAVPSEAIAQLYSLLGAVLRNSELVEDAELKAGEMRHVVHGWSVLAMMITADVEAMRQLGDLLEPLIGELQSGEEGADVVEHIASLLILALMGVGLEGRVGTPRLERALIDVLDDQEFMDTTLHALFATMLYASLRLSGWPARVKTLVERHGKNTLVVSLVQQWMLVRYRTEDLHDTAKGVLEEVLADIMLSSETESSGPAAIVDRARRRAEVLESLRHSRLITRQRIKAVTRDAENAGTASGRRNDGSE